ncbi:MAG: tetratricopeptide repeat protein [Thermoguttaceae bacterium]|nr:tetratricopeptide repeat protein [Thermoguttaceae bacterium]
MTRTGTTTEQLDVRSGKARLFPILRGVILLAAALLFADAARAQSGPLISSGLSTVSRPGSSIYSRKGTASTQKKTGAVELYADDSTRTDGSDSTSSKEKKSARTPSVSVPRSPLAEARAAKTDQPKVVDDQLLSELTHPGPRPSHSRGGSARQLGAASANSSGATPAPQYSYFDDSDFDPADVPGASEAAPPTKPSAATPGAENRPITEFPELEGYDLPDELPPEPSQGFQSFAEEIYSRGTNASEAASTVPAPAPTSAGEFADIETLAAPSESAAPAATAADASAPVESAKPVQAAETEPSVPTPTAGGEFADIETLAAPSESAAPAATAADASAPSEAAEPVKVANAEPPRYDSGFTVSGDSAAEKPNGTPPAPAAAPRPDYGGFAEVETLDDPESAASPPGESEFPEFARNAYEALEPSEEELTSVIDREKGKPERERKSIAEKEETEKELKAEYDAWLAKQRAGQKEKDKLPRYLQPLEDDHEIFESEDSPYARGKEQSAAEEHKFVREISAADLNLMSDVSSNRELMDWEKEQDAPVDWSKYSASTLYNKWRDYIGMGPNEKEALAIMKKATLALMEWEKTKDPKQLREAGELYEKAGKKWPDSILEEDALFYAGECSFFGRNYTKAKTFYKALLKKYSNSVLRRDAMERLYWIGVYWVKCAEEDPEVIGRFEGKERPRFSDFAGAKDAFETIFTNDVSDRGRAPDAVFALANAYMRRGVQQGDASFEEAAKYYQRLYEFYPACKYADRAYQLAMLALYQSYRGPFYDSTPLRRAEEIAKTAQRAHKGDPKVIEEQLRLIREKQAEYLLVRGEYYEKKKIYASARGYYQRLIEEFPDSEYAAKGAERYTAIRENPAESDQFALIRPIAPFLPETNNQYYEDQPSERLSAAVRGEDDGKKDIAEPDFTQLEKTAEAGQTESEVR